MGAVVTSLRGQRPINRFEMAAASRSGRMVFVRRDARHSAITKPDRAEVVVAETGAGLAILPDLEIVSKLAVARRAHDFEYSFLVIPWIDRNRASFKAPAGREKRAGNERPIAARHMSPSGGQSRLERAVNL